MEAFLERPRVMPRRLLSPTNSPGGEGYCPVPKPRTPMSTSRDSSIATPSPPVPKPRLSLGVKRKQEDVESTESEHSVDLKSWISVNISGSNYPGTAKKDQICLDLGSKQYTTGGHTASTSFPIYHDINDNSRSSSRSKSSSGSSHQSRKKRRRVDNGYYKPNFSCTLL